MSTKGGERLAQEWGMLFFEVSAASNANLDEAFKKFLPEVMLRKPC